MYKEKNIISSFIYNTMFTILNLIFPIITMPYISRTIGVIGVGKVNFATSIVNYFLMVASLGIPLYGVREIAKVRDDKKKVSETFSEIFIINTISTIICIISYYFMIFSMNSFHGELSLYIISGISLALNLLNLEWFFKGMEEYKYIAIRSAIIKVCSLVLLFIFVKTKEDYVTYAFINILALSGNNLINIINIRKYTKISFRNIHIKKRLKPIVVLLSVQVAVNIYINLDTTMCGVISGDASVGYYSNAIKISRIVSSVIISIAAILLPRLSFYIENDEKEKFNNLINKTFNVLLFVSVPSAVGLFFTAPQVINMLFGSEFFASISTLRLLTPLIIILSIGNLFGTQVLMPTGNENKLLISVIVGAVSNLVLNSILIPLYSQDGAAIATVVSELIVMLIQVYYAIKITNINLKKGEIKKILFASFCMMLGLIIVRLVIYNQITLLLTSIIIGILIYSIVSVFIKCDTVKFIYTKIISRF